MDIDLSKLIGTPTAPQTGFTADKVELSTPMEKTPENAPQEATDPAAVVRQIRETFTQDANQLERMKLERLQSTAARYREGYREYQENIKRAGTLREQITKGVKAGADRSTLLLQAIECIAAMTGDSLFYSYLSEILTAKP